MANIGSNIKKFRLKKGLTQEELSKKANVKYTTLTKIESGVIEKPSVYIVAKLAQALSVFIEELLR